MYCLTLGLPRYFSGEEHYNCASALQKSIRGSNADGAIYWMTRMLEGGEDPLFIARRLVVCASEDIGEKRDVKMKYGS